MPRARRVCVGRDGCQPLQTCSCQGCELQHKWAGSLVISHVDQAGGTSTAGVCWGSGSRTVHSPSLHKPGHQRGNRQQGECTCCSIPQHCSWAGAEPSRMAASLGQPGMGLWVMLEMLQGLVPCLQPLQSDGIKDSLPISGGLQSQQFGPLRAHRGHFTLPGWTLTPWTHRGSWLWQNAMLQLTPHSVPMTSQTSPAALPH